MEMIRTTKIKLDLSVETAQQTLDEWSNACNFISRVAFANGNMTNTVKLHRLVYADVRAQFKLSSQVVQSAVRHVASKYAAIKTTNKKPKRPVFFKPSGMVLQGGARGRDFAFQAKGLSIWTLAGRLKGVGYHGAPKLAEFVSDWRMGDARLFIRAGKVYLAVSFKRDILPFEKPNNAVVGVDRGIKQLAVVTDGKRQVFYGGGHTKHVRDRYAKKRAELQRKKAERNTRSIRRALKRLRGKEARFQKDVNHVVSKGIVSFAATVGCPTIAVEQLTGIRDRSRKMRKAQRRDINGWAFYQLEEFICYKAETLGFEMLHVDAAYTSQGCSRCGHTERANRYRNRFRCKACSFELHADLGGARNVALRGILARQALSPEGASSTALKARPDV